MQIHQHDLPGSTELISWLLGHSIHDYPTKKTETAKLQLLASRFGPVFHHSSTAHTATLAFIVKMARSEDPIVVHSKAQGFTSVLIESKKTNGIYWVRNDWSFPVSSR